MVLKICFVIFVSLIFDFKVLALNKPLYNNVIIVYAPNQMLQPLYTALDAIPGLEYHTELRDRNGSHNIHRRIRALPASYGGYTANPDTCKLYNHNLLKIWNILSKHINSHKELPDNLALHNIVQLIKAYLDHHDLHDVTTHTNIAIIDKTENANIDIDFTETVTKILELLEGIIDEHTPNKIVDLILYNQNISSFTQNNNLKCTMDAKKVLTADVNKGFQKYLDDANCRRGTNVKIDLYNEKENESNRNKIQAVTLKDLKLDFLDTKKFLRQWHESGNRFENCVVTAREKFVEGVKTSIKNFIVALQCSKL